MVNIFNEDFKQFIDALNHHNVEYMIVGGYAVILNGYLRSTSSLDVWVNVTAENHKRLIKAFSSFGLPASDINEGNFFGNNEVDVFAYGIPPISIEILKIVKGGDFKSAYDLSNVYDENGLKVRYIHLNTLIEVKKAAGRYKDMDDVEMLANVPS